jgi:hypothetical protein
LSLLTSDGKEGVIDTMSDVQILHAIPGRIRFKMRQVKEHPAFANQLEQTLARMQMVKWSKIVTVQPVTT